MAGHGEGSKETGRPMGYRFATNSDTLGPILPKRSKLQTIGLDLAMVARLPSLGKDPPGTMSLFNELTRLEARYAAAQASDDSCPRNREILKAKIEDLKLDLPDGRTASEAPVDGMLVKDEPSSEGAEVLARLETWQNEHLRLWEQGQ